MSIVELSSHVQMRAAREPPRLEARETGFLYITDKLLLRAYGTIHSLRS